MTETQSSVAQPPARWQIEWELCDIAASVSTLPRDRISPTSRMIQDLHLDSLCLLEFIMTVEERFGVTIPDLREVTGFAKQVFTRDPLLLRDFAEVVLIQWGPERQIVGSAIVGRIVP